MGRKRRKSNVEKPDIVDTFKYGGPTTSDNYPVYEPILRERGRNGDTHYEIVTGP